MLLMAAVSVRAQQTDLGTAVDEKSLDSSGIRRSDDRSGDVLTRDEWRRVDAAVDRALAWLAAQQDPDGSFPTLPSGQPGVTSLCMITFAAHGHVPGEGTYGNQLEPATQFVLSCQKANGLVTLVGPKGPRITRLTNYEIGTTAAYNHAISSLLLSEIYGMSGADRGSKLQSAIDKALAATLEMQSWPKDRQADRGGWRYIDDKDARDSDLSITGWQLMFLRSARNAGFDVPNQPIDEAVAYVRRCFSEQYGAFVYVTGDGDHRSRAMAGAGILALAHAGHHNAAEARRSGDWILQHEFDRYNVLMPFNQSLPHDRYHYAVFNCCQGMYQLGGVFWETFFPPVVRTLLANQQPDGSWPADSHLSDGKFGKAYTTALAVMTLGAPNQMLPIFQR
jgi:hypothetical protein